MSKLLSVPQPALPDGITVTDMTNMYTDYTEWMRLAELDRITGNSRREVDNRFCALAIGEIMRYRVKEATLINGRQYSDNPQSLKYLYCSSAVHTGTRQKRQLSRVQKLCIAGLVSFAVGVIGTLIYANWSVN